MVSMAIVLFVRLWKGSCRNKLLPAAASARRQREHGFPAGRQAGRQWEAGWQAGKAPRSSYISDAYYLSALSRCRPARYGPKHLNFVELPADFVQQQ